MLKLLLVLLTAASPVFAQSGMSGEGTIGNGENNFTGMGNGAEVIPGLSGGLSNDDTFQGAYTHISNNPSSIDALVGSMGGTSSSQESLQVVPAPSVKHPGIQSVVEEQTPTKPSETGVAPEQRQTAGKQTSAPFESVAPNASNNPAGETHQPAVLAPSSQKPETAAVDLEKTSQNVQEPGANQKGVLEKTYSNVENNSPNSSASSELADIAAGARESIVRVASLAGSVPAEQTPELIRSAIEKTVAMKNLSVSDAQDIARQIVPHLEFKSDQNDPVRIVAAALLTHAVIHARRGLPELADKACAAASKNDKTTLAAILGASGEDEGGELSVSAMQASKSGALDRWNELLTSAGKPIENLQELKDYINSIQNGARLSDGTAPTIHFRPGHNGFVAELPPLAVPKGLEAMAMSPAAVPTLAKDFVNIDPSGASERLSRREILAYLKQHGAGFLERGIFLVRMWWVQFRFWLFERIGPPIPKFSSRWEIPGVMADLKSHLAKLDLMERQKTPMTMSDVHVYLAQVMDLAKDYERLTGDASADFIMEDFARRIATLSRGLSPTDPAPEALQRLVVPVDEDTLSHWAKRLKDIANAMAR